MKQGLLAGIFTIIACGVPALAADMALKAPPTAPAPYSWTGCYLGGNIGAGWANNKINDVTVVPNVNTGSDTGTGVVGGGQVGCDYQSSNQWVVGIQAMFDGAGIKGSHRYIGPTASADETLTTKTRSFATLTGRIGYAVMPQALLYLKGGAAWAGENYTDVDPTVPYSGQANATRRGWTIGAGAEYAFLPDWSAFVEYDYIGLGNRNATLTYSPAGTFTYNEKNNLQTFLVGLNYRFRGLAGR
ncbi:MAG TPA: outer membrane beta-barrel protein [Xanthobacteraceae bacterium]|nr:outer membrane beta-barrel protein [Xanthobacteraceae bacterium]